MNAAALSHLVSSLVRLVRQGAESLGLRDAQIDGQSLEGILGGILDRWTKSIDALGPVELGTTPISKLRVRLSLPQEAVEALVLSLSDRIEPVFGTIWQGLLHQGRSLDFHSALNLIVPNPVERLGLLRLADADGLLVRLALLQRGHRDRLYACDRLLAYFWGHGGVDSSLKPRIDLATPFEASKLGDSALTQRLLVLKPSVQQSADVSVVFQGADRQSRFEAARALLDSGGVFVDLWGFLGGKVIEAEQVGQVFREAALLDYPIIVDAGCPESQVPELKAVLRAILEGANTPVFVLNRHFKLADLSFPHKVLSLVQVRKLNLDSQRLLWEQNLEKQGALGSSVDVGLLSERFDMTASQIEVATQLARTLRDAKGSGSAIELEDLQRGSVEVFTHELGGLAWRIAPCELAFDDLVIPLEVRRQLLMMLTYIRHRRMVYDGWGMSRLLTGGRGVKALFYGPPGTGKTLAASILARELGLEVYQVDLSQIVSKWVGETEKNLDRVLTAAQDSQVVLLFDEADSLFGERGEVKSATDRYANMEVNYLLQRFDLYDGMVILTSNLVESVDKAFSRRLHFQVEFPAPDRGQRKELWHRMLGKDLPLAGDVDIDTLASRFELSGGDIRNVVMTGAFLAAEASSEVTHLHLLQALAWEMQKQGKVPSRSAFGEHWNQLQ